MVLTLSILALLCTFYQLYLQRRHDEKSLKPLVQIDVTDRKDLIAVRIHNNGLGPFVIEYLSFIKGDEAYNSIRKCISLHPRTYNNVAVSETVMKVILPGTYLDVFSVRLKESDTSDYIATVRRELSALKLIAKGHDIYDNTIIAERELDWFLNYLEI